MKINKDGGKPFVVFLHITYFNLKKHTVDINIYQYLKACGFILGDSTQYMIEECEYTNWQKRNEKLLVHLDKPVSRLLTCHELFSAN